MTVPVASIHWRALDHAGEEKCRLSQADKGWLIVGHVKLTDDLGYAELDYIVRCNTDWTTQSADLTGQHGGREVQARIVNDNGRWWVGNTEQPAVEGATDLDLSFTPATNLMPLRRLLSSDLVELGVSAAWLRYPEAQLQRLDQSYARTGEPGRIAYHGHQTSFQTELTVHDSGFVTLYPDLWEGQVADAG